ncbi:putative leader peptide [Streptomyces sp. NPDC060000]|uniref:putative leader peptide n=1 Tax=Streptomyces sp. NPDC060000 TaxID=3347031 RepID=UPI0036971F89
MKARRGHRLRKRVAPVEGPERWRASVRHSGNPSASITTAALFSGFSRRRHIDLQRSASCLCQG